MIRDRIFPFAGMALINKDSRNGVNLTRKVFLSPKNDVNLTQDWWKSCRKGVYDALCYALIPPFPYSRHSRIQVRILEWVI